MKINSITNYGQVSRNLNFKHTAVPYPEYENAYGKNNNEVNVVESFVQKIAELFSPKVSKEANAIKQEIDYIYSDSQITPKQALLSVIA